MSHIRRWPVLIALVGLAGLIILLVGLNWRQPVTEVPEVGGVYTEAVIGRPRSLVPLFAQSELEQDLAALLFRGLTRTDAQGVVVPDAAREWAVSSDGLIYTFRLRDDIFWSDGRPVSTDDVLFTVRCLQTPATNANSFLVAFWRTVAVEPLDAQTIRFTLSEPFAPFLDQTTVGLMPAHIFAGNPMSDLTGHPFNTQPISNGPFVVEKFDDMAVTLAPNPFEAGRQPYLTRLVFKFYPDRVAAISAYQRKDVMGIGHVAAGDLSKLTYGSLYSAPRPVFTAVYLNHDRPMFKDRRTRQALLLGLNRAEIIRQALQGQALVADSPIIPQSWASASDIPRYVHDPVRARSLLEEVGWVDANQDGVREREGQPFEFTLVVPDEPARRAVAEMLAQQWAAIGVKALVQPVNSRQIEQVYFQTRLYDAALYGWSVPESDPDPYPLWHSTQIGEGQNVVGWVNQQADNLLETARQTPDPVRRAVLYRQFQTVFAEEVPSLLLYYGVYHFVVDPQVHNVQLGQLLLTPSDRFQTILQWYIRTKTIRGS